MIDDVRRALDTIVGAVSLLGHANGAGRMFELFVMSAIARGLRQAGFDVWLQRSDGTRIQPTDGVRRFVQRGGAPTGILPAASGPNNAGVIGFRWQRQDAWEIWNGIQFQGRSDATHEIDVSIVPASIGDQLRSTGGVPVGRPRVAIECKDVGLDGGLDEMRAFVARLYDVTLLHAHHRYLRYAERKAMHPGSPARSTHRATLTFRQENQRTRNMIARRTGFTDGTEPLARYHGIEQHAEIVADGISIEGLVLSVVEWALANAR